MPDRLRSLPSVDRLLDHESLAEGRMTWSRRAVVAVLRDELGKARGRVMAGHDAPTVDEIAARCGERLARLARIRPRRVVNATGVVIHTNMGRAPLGGAALAEACEAAARYCDLELDLSGGGRGDRHGHVAELMSLLFPGRASLITNNNAAAMLLVLNTLAHEREVVISRGELVEIGGSFRVPEILERSGARLVEVGTTNRTHLSDYERALTPKTGLILRVWPSNYRIVGYTRAVPLEELVALSRRAGLPVVVDQGCGRMFRDSPGPASETPVEDLLDGGADLVCFSGDKLFAGPQSGVLLGQPELVERCVRNPLARALRPGKLTLALMASTCRRWLARDLDEDELPAAGMLSRSAEALDRAARGLADAIARCTPVARVEVKDGVSRVGGGSAPEEDLPTRLVVLEIPGITEQRLLDRLRANDPPVIARIAKGAVVLDPRTLRDDEPELVVDAVRRAAGEGRAGERAAAAE